MASSPLSIRGQLTELFLNLCVESIGAKLGLKEDSGWVCCLIVCRALKLFMYVVQIRFYSGCKMMTMLAKKAEKFVCVCVVCVSERERDPVCVCECV